MIAKECSSKKYFVARAISNYKCIVHLHSTCVPTLLIEHVPLLITYLQEGRYTRGVLIAWGSVVREAVPAPSLLLVWLKV